MSIVRLTPWRERDGVASNGGWAPRVDVWETAEAYRMDAEIPAVSAEEVEVSINEGVLSIRGERKTASLDEGDRRHHTERRFGPFYRSFRLPDNADADRVSARVANGVLELTIDKQTAAVPRRIEVIAA